MPVAAQRPVQANRHMAADPVANHSEEFAFDADHAGVNHVKKSKADKKKEKKLRQKQNKQQRRWSDPCCTVTSDLFQKCCC